MNIFLSTSFSCRVDQHGEVLADYKALIQDRLQQLRGQGHTVFCVIEHRNWKMLKNESKGAEVGFDIAKIRESDAIVAVFGKEISAGLQWECGFMTGLGKPVYAWPENDTVQLPYWNQGLIETGEIVLIHSKEEVKV